MSRPERGGRASRLDKLALKLMHFAYPANRPSLLPFPIRREAANMGIRGLLWCHKLGGYLKRGIGVVDPDGKRY